MSDSYPHQYFLSLCLVALVVTVAIDSVLATRDTDVVTADSPEGWAHMMTGLRLLQVGSFQEKKEVAGMAFEWFRPLETLPPEHADDVDEVVDALRQIVHLNTDDWITSQLLESLGLEDWGVLAWVFRDALDSPSINARRQAIRWYADHQDPSALPVLEDAWRDESRPWVRADLVEALARQASTEHLDDFMRLAKSDDPAIAAAAVRALGVLADDEAVPLLAKIARHGPQRNRVEALQALTSWPGDPEALQPLIDATRASEPALQFVAIEGMKAFENPAATQRLIEIVTSSETESLRIAAMKSVEARGGAEVVGALLEALRSAPLRPGHSIGGEALRMLHNIDDPSVIPDLMNLNSVVSIPGESVSELIDYLSRDRYAVPARPIIEISSSCGVALDPADPEVLRVVPPPGWRSVRCWEAPDVPGDPSEYERLAAGDLSKITDYFESQDGLWISSEQHGYTECWIPRRYLSEPAAGPPPDKTEADEPFTREFDLPVNEIRTRAAEQLLNLGLLEEIDPAGEITGVRLAVDPTNRRDVFLLTQGFASNQSILDAQIAHLVRGLFPRFRNVPELATLLQSVVNRAGPGDDD